MKAIQLHGYGDVDQLVYEDVPDPKPQSGEVLVQVVSTSVNPIDYKLRSGAMQQQMKLQFPMILGSDVAGVVHAVAPDVTSLKVGDRVIGLVKQSYAEFLVAKAEELALAPAGIPLEEAGRLPLVLVTGAQLIERGVQPKPGERVLVTGAVGSVGRTAVHVARSLGAHVIAGVRKNQLEEAKLIAEETVALDDDAAIQALAPFDALADTVDGPTIAKLLPKYNRKGAFASVLGKPDAAEKAGVEVKTVYAQPDAHRLRQLAEEVAAGKLQIPIAKSFPLREAGAAQKFAEAGASGKVILLP